MPGEKGRACVLAGSHSRPCCLPELGGCGVEKLIVGLTYFASLENSSCWFSGERTAIVSPSRDGLVTAASGIFNVVYAVCGGEVINS